MAERSLCSASPFRVFSALCLFHLIVIFLYLLVVDGLFTFENLQSHIGCSQITCHTDKIGLICPLSIDDIILTSLADAGNVDGEPGI